MRRNTLLAIALLGGLVAASPLAAQRDSTRADTTRADTIRADTAKPSAEGLPLKPTRTVSFTTDEGTWLSLDVSPDGRTIVFDLLGDLYTLPIAGGKATPITRGMAFDGQPRYSPDGRSIVYVSDSSGAENVWTVDADGRNPRAVTKGQRTSYASPEWTPDGKYIVVSKDKMYPTFSWYDLYLYNRYGGAGVKLTGAGTQGPPSPYRPPVPDNFMGAAFGKDPRYIYAAVKQKPFEYNLQLPSWQVAVYDRETGKTFYRTDAPGSGMRPVLSPDGRWLVYATRRDTATALRLRDLASGDETWLATAVQRDDQESRFTRDLMPGSSFTPDSRALITSYGGKLWRVEVPSGRATAIPFTADVRQEMGPPLRFAYGINDTTLTVQQIRGARPSPDGRRLVFTALDKLWIMDLPRGRPRRLTTSALGEHSPVWSPDGRWVAYVTWSDQGGDVMRVAPQPGSRPERLTRQSAFYEKLNYTPDGRRLVVARGPRQRRVEGEDPASGPASAIELTWLPAAGGETRAITPLNAYGWPHFTRDSARVYIYDAADGLVSMRFDGTDRKAILKVTGFTPPPLGEGPPQADQADEILISPDGDRMLASVNNNLWLVTAPVVGGQTLTVSVSAPDAAQVPLKRVTRIGGDFVGWANDGRSFYYSAGHSFFTYDVARADSLVRDSTSRADSVARAATGAGARPDTGRARPAGRRRPHDLGLGARGSHRHGAARPARLRAGARGSAHHGPA